LMRERRGAFGLRRWRLLAALLLFLILAAAVLLVFVQPNCPRQGAALSAEVRAFVRLKNRDALPRPEEFDRSVGLEELLRPGDDRARWSEARAAALEGYVVGVRPGGVEAANCYSFTRRDTHIYVAARPDALPRERVVLEVTPRMEAWAAARGRDWSEPALRRALMGRRCRFEGWLLYDTEHDEEAENTAPGRLDNWRATGWELHPVTNIEIVR
jgi:hypothetical protein